jgi:hypothetical protein
VRQPHGSSFLERLSALTHLDDLRYCFLYQILQPRCPITHFYDFYQVAGTAGEEIDHEHRDTI